MRVIGLTGGIGTGKSTISKYLAELGAAVIDADKVGHEAFEPGMEAYKEVVAAFGSEIVSPDGGIDRKKLASIVFPDPKKVETLNHIMHTRMRKMVEEMIENYRRTGKIAVVVEAPLLIEANWISLVDEIWVVTAPESVVLKRVKDQRGQTEEQTRARIANQLSNEIRTGYANVLINNDGNLDEVRKKVRQEWEKFIDKSEPKG
jgi:dephospho-CoA kinase